MLETAGFIDAIQAELGGRQPIVLWYISAELADNLPISLIENLTSCPSLIMDVGRVTGGGILISVFAARCTPAHLEEMLGALGALSGILPAEVV